MRREAFGAPSNVASESLPTEANNNANIAANRGAIQGPKQGSGPMKQPLRDTTTRKALGTILNNVPVKVKSNSNSNSNTKAKLKAPRVIPREADGSIEAPGYISVPTEEDILLAQRPKSPVLSFIHEPSDLVPLVSRVSEDVFDMEPIVVKTRSRPTSPLVDALFPTDSLVNQFDLNDIALLDDFDDDELVLA